MAISTDYLMQTTPMVQTSGGTSTLANGDFDTFLKMLTTQITNQDPLNPMEGSDFAVQLATFSGVEQQTRTNQLVEGLAAQMGLSGLSQVSGWIGKEVRSSEPVWFGSQPVTLEVQPDSSADQVVLVTCDSQGRTVSREEIGIGSGQIDWYGLDATGAKLADGSYSFAIESMREGAVISTRAVESYARVTEARLVDGKAMLVLAGGAEVAAADVTALRELRD